MSTYTVSVTSRNVDHWSWSVDGGPETMMPPGSTYADITIGEAAPVSTTPVVSLSTIRITGTARSIGETRRNSGGSWEVYGTTNYYSITNFDETVDASEAGTNTIITKLFRYSNAQNGKHTSWNESVVSLNLVSTGSSAELLVDGVSHGRNFADIKVYQDGSLIYEQPNSDDYSETLKNYVTI